MPNTYDFSTCYFSPIFCKTLWRQDKMLKQWKLYKMVHIKNDRQ